jgi:hypothetical protein
MSDDHNHSHQDENALDEVGAFDFDRACKARRHVMVSKREWDTMSTGAQIRRLMRAWFSRTHLIPMNGIPDGHEMKAPGLMDMVKNAGFDSLDEAVAAYKRNEAKNLGAEMGAVLLGPFSSDTPGDLPPGLLEALGEAIQGLVGGNLNDEKSPRGSAYDTVPNLEEMLAKFEEHNGYSVGEDDDDEDDEDEGEEE